MRDFRFRGQILLLALCVSITAILSGCERGTSSGTPGESVYARVMRTKKIRAAWLTYPPAAMKDTASGKLQGTFVETLNAIAKNNGLEVEWMDGETPWGTQIEGLEEDRYDIIGSPVWANYTRARLATLSAPVYYSGIGIFVRKNDARFPDDWATGTVAELTALLNRPEVKIATIDGETGDLIAKTQFPLATRIPLPQNADIPQLFLEVADNKADVLFAEPYFANQYLKNNPGKIRNIAEKTPIQVLGNCFMLKKGEWQLKQMIDIAIEDQQNSGVTEGLVEKYETAPGQFYHVALPYRSSAPESIKGPPSAAKTHASANSAK
jgi:ABC-type amino acid transport substrate-binding protein